MYLLRADSAHNRLYVTLSERFDEPQAKAFLDELRLRLEELEPGFDVLCDLTTLEQFDHSAVKHYEIAMDLCNQSGVHKVIRIIPNPINNFGLTIMSHFHYGDHVSVITCENLEAASKRL